MLRKSDFIEQLECIQKSGIPVLALEQYLLYGSKEPKGIIITFDDGNLSDYTIAIPLLKAYSMTASFYPVIADMGKEEKINWNQLREINAQGHEVGSHSINHLDMLRLSPEEQTYELTNSKKTLEQKLEQEITVFSVPFGRYNRRILRRIKASRYRAALSSNKRVNRNHAAPVLHRWNIKEGMSIVAFNKIVTFHRGTLIRNLIWSERIRFASQIVPLPLMLWAQASLSKLFSWKPSSPFR